ncbi:hypothetical protein [Escherichia coli]|uniref:hypothetical protein n=1 Tax=Escherichia coli TaxID=562 RepID=UPI0039A673A3
MSTTAFLDKLDYRQLQFCRDECDRRIKAIQEEEKKVAWAVTDRGLIFGWLVPYGGLPESSGIIGA